MDIGGGIIKRESIIAVLLVLTMALPLGANTAFAATNITNTTSSQLNTNTTNTVNKTNATNNLTKTTTVQAAGSPTNTSFTSSQINGAASKVQTFVAVNHRLPNYVTIGTYQVTMPQFLQLITANLLNINKGLNVPVILKTVKTPANTTETVKNGTISKSEYLTLAQTIQTAISSTGTAPSYVNSSLGKINFQNLVYSFSKILNFQVTNLRLPNSLSVTPWTTTTSSAVTGEGNVVLRPVYIVSDYINNLQMDNARINALVSALNKMGVKAYNKGVGVNPDSILTSLPSNALLVEILGGVDAGYIQEKGSAWYKGLLGDRKDFFVLTPGTTKTYYGGVINNDLNVAWAPRAWDDNYDPSSFTGIAYPGTIPLKKWCQLL